NSPVEARVRRGFLRSARARLEQFNPLVIAVAGSYGKTSTKHILAHLLQPYGETLATPKSFNTLMGVSRTVNDLLEDRHRTFLVEMDAYAPGEIAAICGLVRPRNALVTSVGPQHLERFVTMDRVAGALFETVQALPADGFAVLYSGDAESAALARRARREGRSVVTYGMDGDAADLDVLASDVTITGESARFTWCWPAEGLRQQLTVPLLGRHQVLNVSAALVTVHRLGLPLQPALDAVATLTPVEHRLQPVPTGNAITVIDDSYNANPVGVHNGLEVLAEIDAGSRILVTPGLVELGAVEDAENRRYGEHAAKVCDHVIVVDARPARAFREGLIAGGLGEDRIHVVRSLEEATVVIGRVATAGDAVLFANDLPDTYLGAA
ncbi:MAG: UDP-N-acetylmuramoyl-tripeptide--D-alanyl-D-alanine ligase, partial [Candidatus Dormibacteraeota bacterium]|nr:UDP-N-acetylmuramoyl-tripeptide--D-alanyl-D-alanine ligase [Candidatus Dormibacteraeota bacterium]